MTQSIRLKGIIAQDGSSVETADGKKFGIPTRGTASDGWPAVLIDAQRVDGEAQWKRQSVKKWVGFPVEFLSANGETGFNFEIYAK